MKVIWVTGLSGSGKSTLAREVVNILREKGKTVILLDGDELREVFGAVNQNDKNHTYDGRLALSKQYSNLCKLIASQGVIVVLQLFLYSMISMNGIERTYQTTLKFISKYQ